MCAVLRWLGVALERQGRPAEAREHYMRVRDLARARGDRMHEGWALIGIGYQDSRQGRGAEAIDAYERVMRLPSPRYRALALAGRGQVRLDLLDRRREALDDLRRSLEIDPRHDEARRVQETIRRLESTERAPPGDER